MTKLTINEITQINAGFQEQLLNLAEFLHMTTEAIEEQEVAESCFYYNKDQGFGQAVCHAGKSIIYAVAAAIVLQRLVQPPWLALQRRFNIH